MVKTMRTTDTHVYFYTGIYSNWHWCEFEVGGIAYNCGEQYMMHRKAVLFDDSFTAGKILRSVSPREQKDLGRRVQGYDDKIWSEDRLAIMQYGLYYKFEQNPEFGKQILDTGSRILVEASPYDRIWGVGLGEENDLILDEANWKGQNLLGKALMQVRDVLRNGNFNGSMV